jgi:peptidyl-prolyl cis-trans isomerase SurA
VNAEVKEAEVSSFEEKTNTTTQEETEIKQVKTAIKDGLYIIVGERAITKSDIVNEIKINLILNNESYSDDKQKMLNKMAIKSSIERNIKEIEISKLNFLEYNQQDLMNEIERLANQINMDVDTLKNICASNDLNFTLIENQIKTELLWNSLIFHLYKDKLIINVEEIEEQLKLNQKKQLNEYLISEILFKPVQPDNLEFEINELKNKIKIEGFENVAKNLSISKSAPNGGDLGWINENIISEKIKNKIFETAIGDISKPIILTEGVLIFKVRNKRKIDKNLEEEKNKLVNSEKTKILKMYSSSHYDKLRRSISIKFIQ